MDCSCCNETFADAPADMPLQTEFVDAPAECPIFFTWDEVSEQIIVSINDDYEAFLDVLGYLESGNRYDCWTGTQYLGRFQTGELCLIDTGFKDWDGNWTALANSYGVYSVADYLNTPEAQDYVIGQAMKNNWRYLKNNGSSEHLHEVWEGVEITKSGLIGAAHLVGAGAVRTIFDGENPVDGNGTEAYYYLEVLGDYNLDSVIP